MQRAFIFFFDVSVIPGWRLERLLFDFMHITALGTDKDFAPSMIFDLEMNGCLDYLGDTTRERLQGLGLGLKLLCKKQGRQPPSRRGFSKKLSGLRDWGIRRNGLI